MARVMVVLAAVLSVAGLMGAPRATAGEMTHGAGDMPQIVAFDNEDFLGDHMHIFGDMRDLGKWGNSISPLVILSGTWESFDDEDFKGTSMGTLGPEMYADITGNSLKNNSISSARRAKPTGGSTR